MDNTDDMTQHMQYAWLRNIRTSEASSLCVHCSFYLVFKVRIAASHQGSRLLSLSSVPVSLIQRLTIYFKFERDVVRLGSTNVLFSLPHYQYSTSGGQYNQFGQYLNKLKQLVKCGTDELPCSTDNLIYHGSGRNLVFCCIT